MHARLFAPIAVLALAAPALFAPALVAPVRAADPSFDCTKASGSVEKMICKDDTLAGLDRETTLLYGLAVTGRHITPARLKELKSTQVGWIKGRNDCWKASDARDCVLDNYAIRIHQLRQGYADARKQDGKGKSIGPLAADCTGFGAGIAVTFVNVEPDFVVLQWHKETWVLTRTRSGSGARYSKKLPAGEMVFWNKGDEALFELPGKPVRNCKLEKIG